MKRTVASEQFFTSVATAQKCVAAVERLFPFEQFDLIVEPSAGAGAFLQFLPISNRIGLDIAPLHADIVKQDFLAWQPREEFHTILTIGNPPYGQRAALAAKFIAHACSFSEVVAFILPQSFNKYTFQNRVPRNFHLQNSFNCDQFETPTGQQLIVKSVFQIWEKQATPRQI
ncbi:MAG: hypothetical protein LBB58_05585, partial [Cellulomonadaceae bacterium]|nr:hypothetical protein [Cellulomonadaceae bacterium]